MHSQSTLAQPRHASSTSTHAVAPQRVAGLSSGHAMPGVPPQSVLAAPYNGFNQSAPDWAWREAAIELGIGAKRQRLARGAQAAYRSLVVTRTVADTLDALGEKKWAHRVRQCGQHFQTIGCNNGCGGTCVPSVLAKRCGLACCPSCSRSAARRLSSEAWHTLQGYQGKKGFRWKFLTLALQPRATYGESWRDITKVREKVMGFLKKLGYRDALSAIEFGGKAHPHLHVLFYGGWIDRDILSRMLVGWTGGRVRELAPDEWVAVGRRKTKRGKQHFRKWVAVPPKSGIGGDWYVDVREVEGGLNRALREVAKYLANPYGDGVLSDAQGQAKIIGAARVAAAVAVAGKGKHRVQGYGVFRGIVGRALGKTKAAQSQAAVAAAAGLPSPRSWRCCQDCGAPLVLVQGIDAKALRWFNRKRIAALYAQAPPAPP